MLSIAGIAGAAAIETPYIVVDMDSGKVLSSRNPHQLWYPASVTKLMNAYVVFKALREGRISGSTQVVVSKHALAEPPSKMGFKAGTVIDLDNALKMMMVHSSNDIAMAIAETVGGSEGGFVAMMNGEAARLGLASTHFINPNGLPGAGQYTTARDLAVLARALWIEFPQYRPLFRITAIRSGKRVLKSANSLLERYPGTVGMKTGFICSSGFNVVAAAQRGGRTLVAVVLGSDNAKDRAELAGRLLNDGFGSSSGPMRPTLASYRGNSPVPYVIDMKPYICQRKDRGENEDDAAAEIHQSALVPKFKLMDPVTVTTLGMRKPDGSVAPAASVAAQDDGAPAKAKPTKKTAKKVKKPEASDTASTDTATPDAAPAPKPAKKKPAKTNGDKANADKAGTVSDATPPATKASASAPAKVQKSKPSKIEVGVPFDSTDVAPLPDVPAAAFTQ